MPHPVIESAQRFRTGLLRRERMRAGLLVRAYGRAYGRMTEQIRALEQQVDSLDEPSREHVRRMASLRSLRRQVAEEVGAFAQYADTEIVNGAHLEVERALRESRGLAQAHFTNLRTRQAIAASWNTLPADAVETMLGFVADDSPLHSAIVQRLGPTIAERMFEHMVDAITLGLNPRKVAETVRRELGVGLTWTLTAQRTAQLWAYREATRANYIANSDIVSGWTWYATLGDGRTCMSCIAKHGTVYPVDAVLNDHHNGRCVQVPNVPLAQRLGIQMPDVSPGQQWFSALPVSKQRQYMGAAMHAAYRAGEFRFEDLSRPYEDTVYGEMVREASLKDLLGPRAKDYYTR